MIVVTKIGEQKSQFQINVTTDMFFVMNDMSFDAGFDRRF